MIKRQRS